MRTKTSNIRKTEEKKENKEEKALERIRKVIFSISSMIWLLNKMNVEKQCWQRWKSSEQYCITQHWNNAISFYVITFNHLNSNRVLVLVRLHLLDTIFSIIKINVRKFYTAARISIGCSGRIQKYCSRWQILIENNWYLLNKNKRLQKVAGCRGGK